MERDLDQQLHPARGDLELDRLRRWELMAGRSRPAYRLDLWPVAPAPVAPQPADRERGGDSGGLPGPLASLAAVLAGISVDGRELSVRARLDSPTEREHFRHGGILPFTLRELLMESRPRS